MLTLEVLSLRKAGGMTEEHSVGEVRVVQEDVEEGVVRVFVRWRVEEAEIGIVTFVGG